MGDTQSRTGRVVRWTIGVAVVALLVAAVAGWLTSSYRVATIAPAGSLEVKESRTIAPEGVEAVTIRGVSEAIRLTDSTDGSFEIRLSGTAATSDREAVPKLVTEKKGGTLNVVVEHKPGLSLGFRGADLVLDVALPKGYGGSLSVESVSGAISAVPHRYAAFTAGTTSGAVNLEKLSAPSLTAHSVSGALTARGIAADTVELQSTSGRIELSGDAPAITIRSVSGAIVAGTTRGPSRIEVASTSGRVTLNLPKSSRFTLSAQSTSGAVDCGFPILVTRSGTSGRHGLSGTVGGAGGGEVTLRTTSGAISVRSM